MNVYMLREREGKNYFGKNRRWTPKINCARVFTELGEARKIRSAQKKLMKINPIKIEIVEFELSEKAIL